MQYISILGEVDLKFIKHFYSFCLLFIFFIPLTGTAAEEEEASGGVLEEIVVTARKREETAQSVPIPISALSEAQLEARNITDIQDVERITPNLDFEYSSVNNNNTQVFLRGIGQVNWSTTQDPKIGIYIDGVYLSRPQGGLVDIMDLERVEVLRGPQGTLFGRNTTAGLIQLITKGPTQEQEAYLKLGYGDDGHEMFGGMLNLPLSDNLAARLAVYSKKTDGYMLNALNGDMHGNENSNSYRASLERTGDAYNLRFTYDRFESDIKSPLGSCRFIGPEIGALAGGLPAVGFIFGSYDSMKGNCRNSSSKHSIDNAPDTNAETEVDSYTLTQTLDLSIGELTLISNKREIESWNGSWGWNYGNGPGISGNANLIDVINNPSEISAESHEIRLSGSSDSLDWVIGAYIFEENATEGIDVPLFRGVLPPPAALWPVFYAPGLANIALGTQAFGSRSQGYIVTNENDAVFAEFTYQISDQLDLTVGARRTNDDRYFERWQTLYGGAFDPTYFCPGMPSAEVAPGVVVPLSDRCIQTVSYSETTPRAILSYQQNDDVLIYASYSKGYSSGGFNQDTRMRPFLPEISDNIEIGFKSTLRDGKVRLNGTFFNNSYENQQLTVGRLVDGQPTADLINAQEATLNGIEIEVLAQLSESWSMTLAYGHLEGEYDEFTVEDNVYITAADGSLVESIVTRDLSSIEFGNGGDTDTLDISFIHTTSLQSGGDLVSVIGATIKDDQYFTLENTPSSFTPGYTLVDGRINWNLSDGVTTISFWGKNLTDKEYIYNMLDQAGTIQIGGTDPGLGMVADYWGAPRRVGIEFRRDF